ncbi:hypothetical protein [Limimaricola pyoseonensis]|uniref:Uncharacterized protein n=1 Tax=Limimaricola pyoseonensis TaxID=521013 RepID=A0A1G7GS05_9RHOB|nr:hypothetical protein [Limimaricola pyoseonensis]SDE90896.1 hypothetical protein SAMN04488567_2899 [Limimaricola pyoseonensis]
MTQPARIPRATPAAPIVHGFPLANVNRPPAPGQPEADSLPCRIMSLIANGVTIIAVVLVLIFAASLLADLPALMMREIAL